MSPSDDDELTRAAPRVRAPKTARLLALGALGLLAGCAEDAAPRARRVILITCDTLRADRLGVYGYERDTTPELDAFARGAVVFERAYSAAPMTLPAVCSMLTGRLPAHIGVEHNRHFLHADVRTLAEELSAHGVASAAFVSNWVLVNPPQMPPEFGVRQGFDHFDGNMTAREIVRKMPERGARETTDAAIAWLQEQRAGERERLFLWVHYQDPHGPYTAPPHFVELMQRAPGDEAPLPFAEDTKGHGAIPRYQRLGDEARPEVYRARYDAEIRYFDMHLGRLMAFLEEERLLRDALVVFSADHGESLGERDYWFCHGETLGEELMRVPLIVRFPGDAPAAVAGRGSRSERLVSQLDLWPTIMQAFDLDPGNCPGTSLFDIDGPGTIAVQTLGSHDGAPTRIALVLDTYKLHLHAGAPSGLYDLSRDPGERDDLSAARPEVVARMLAAYGDLRDRDRGARIGTQARPLTAEEDEILTGLGYAGHGD